MSKKTILFFAVVIFLSGFRLAQAGVIISEVKISPTEDRFIKLYNQDNNTVDLTNWYIQRKTQTGTVFNSLVSKTNFENKKINANSYFLISRVSIDKSDLVVGDMTLTESNVIQIKNGNGDVVDKVCWGDVSDCGDSSVPNPISGQSVQFTNHLSATSVAPVASVGTGILVSSGGENNSAISSSSVNSAKTVSVESKIKTQIVGKTFGFVGIPISLQGTAFGLNGEQLHFGKYFWNFGDGDSKEIDLIDASQPLYHTYFYPGDYVVSLDYFQNHYSNVPDASNQIMIKIVPADIIISRVGDEKDFFIELSNNTNYNTDLSSWILASDTKSFIIPHNTTLSAKKKIIISPKITNFSITDKETLKLMNSEREVVFDYGASIVPAETVVENLPAVQPLQTKTLISEVKNVKNSAIAENLTENSVVLPINEVASVESSGVLGQSADNAQPSPFIPIVSIIFIGASACGVYFIRQKRVVPQSGSDFEVLDE